MYWILLDIFRWEPVIILSVLLHRFISTSCLIPPFLRSSTLNIFKNLFEPADKILLAAKLDYIANHILRYAHYFIWTEFKPCHAKKIITGDALWQKGQITGEAPEVRFDKRKLREDRQNHRYHRNHKKKRKERKGEKKREKREKGKEKEREKEKKREKEKHFASQQTGLWKLQGFHISEVCSFHLRKDEEDEEDKYGE